MERPTAQPAKRKIKKDAASAGSSSDATIKKATAASQRDADESSGPQNQNQNKDKDKDHVGVSAEAISVIAESIGICNIGEDVATSLAEDVSYKLQEIINASCTVMRQSKRRKLLTSDVNTAFRVSDVNHIFGHSHNEPFKFLRLPEGEIFIPEDNEVDLISVATNPTAPKVKKPSYIATSYPLLKIAPTQPVNGHSSKSDGKALAFQHPKLGTNNTGVDSRSKFNGGVKFAQPHAIRDKLKRDSEEELKLSQAQISFFNIVAKFIIEGHHCLYKQALLNLRTSKKVNTVSVPLLNFVALSVCHIPRHFGLLSRLLETVDVLLSNVNVNPSYSIAVNRLVNALLAIIADQNVLQGQNDFLLRRKAASLLARVLLVWGIEEQHVSELLSRVALILGDSKEKLQSHYGALVIFQNLGKAAIGWLFPLLKSFLPLFDKRYSLLSGNYNVQVEEIRGTLLDIVELLYCEVDSPRFKIKASTIQELQAMIALDGLLYQYCGDAVCARRRSTTILGQSKLRSHPDRVPRSRMESKLRSHYLDFRYMSHCTQKQRHRQQTSEVFEELCVAPIVRRKDIQFKFAGANPVPKDGLRKKVLDKTHVQFTPVASNQFHSLFPKQHLMVGHMPNSRFKGTTKQFSNLYSLLSVL
ncbi:transcription initiation factor TFIID subunit 6-like isoform X2 [Thrips palmi]|uniref:Transcription initiation factor TFIID subunit 6-like isoform X2 n=1 Tax=Thrips palmi TaxID=161013 RepID=A0A6P8ZQ53_THRPL|nr:transcription initiation factor TFIID subunit 6-like isoform X2 [Thrips palmi]